MVPVCLCLGKSGRGVSKRKTTGFIGNKKKSLEVCTKTPLKASKKQTCPARSL